MKLLVFIFRTVIIERSLTSRTQERPMKVATLLALAFTLPTFAQTEHWTYSVSTGGENVNWVSPTSVDPSADQFDYTYEITYVAIDVIFLGQVIGPTDITADMDPALLLGFGSETGPAPIVMMNELIAADADTDGTIDIAADMYMQLNGKGFGQFDVTNVFLGDVMVDMGWPLGWQNVQLDRIYMDGYIDMTPIVISCPADVNGDNAVNVSDLLATIGNWGGSGDGDVDGSGVVDVSDLLTIVGSWGPCSP